MFSIPRGRRILIITGHYGSGKTELAVSLAMRLAEENTTGYKKLALCDLDIVNPYFRSRERKEILERAGVKVYGGIYGAGTTAEIPELSAGVRAPLEDKDCFTIVDAGGNSAGAKVLTQFGKYFTREERYTLLVLNANRPDTRNLAGAADHLKAIEAELGFEVDGIANNTHMLRETSPRDILKGAVLCKELEGELNKPFIFSTYPKNIISSEELTGVSSPLFPVGLYMRDTWLDR